MKISTITIFNSLNYGAPLQAFALQKELEKLGYETELVNYAKKKSTKYIKLSSSNLLRCLRQLILNCLILVHSKERDALLSRFQSFIDDINKTKYYDTYEELLKNPPMADCFLVGSDQVWNLSRGNRPEFFLSFVKNGIKKASYAASMGNYKYSEKDRETLSNYLKDFVKVSVREQDTVELFKDKLLISAECNIDPVFFLSATEWKSHANITDKSNKYILCYALTRNKVMDKAMEIIRKKTGYEVVVLASQPNHFIKGDRYIYDAGPKEFLGYFANADFIVTTSFHGTAFATIFNKPFYNFTIDSLSSRTNNLLKMLGLENRAISRIEDLKFDTIDYERVNSIISDQINKAELYLNF